MDTQNKPSVHFVAPYIINPLHRIRVDLIGAGGSGSQMLSCLARIDQTLRALDKMGLQVNVYDPDIVEMPNIGRQLFSPAELGMNKAVALVSRFNRFFGLDWDACPRRYEYPNVDGNRPNIIITCVDNLAARRVVAAAMRDDAFSKSPDEYRTWYWLDLGNAQRTGQAVLGSADVPQPTGEKWNAVGRLPILSEEFDLDSVDEADSGPSCSMAEALSKQDLFINSTLVQLSSSLLWKLFTEPSIEQRGLYLNLETLSCLPIPV